MTQNTFNSLVPTKFSFFQNTVLQICKRHIQNVCSITDSIWEFTDYIQFDRHA